MMKKMVGLAFVLLIGGAGARAQGLSNIFSQSSSMLEYYGEQIAAMKLYISKLEKGYQVIESGWQEIKTIKNGDFNIHSAFISSLEQINPAVASMAEVAEIIALQIVIIEKFSTAISSWTNSKSLSAGDLAYVGKVFSNITSASEADVGALITLLTANSYSMSDDQRMRSIQALDARVKDQYAFVENFTNRTELLSQQRLSGQADLGNLKTWYGLP